MRYNAFISYSHSADYRFAATLEAALHHFAKPWRQIRKNLTVFRDKSSLTPNPHLWPTIESALHDSEYFLLPASPFAAASFWVQKEVHCWLDNHREANFLIGLTDGAIAWDNQQNDFAWDRTNALPQQFSTSEKTKLQFRAGAFNLSNTPTFTLPVASAALQWGNKAFGKLTGSQTRRAASAVRPEIFILTGIKRSM